jgi:hypothetical protein
MSICTTSKASCGITSSCTRSNRIAGARPVLNRRELHFKVHIPHIRAAAFSSKVACLHVAMHVLGQG